MKPRALSTLKREASAAARFRGHVIRWAPEHKGWAGGRAASGACRCGAVVQVEQIPAPNGIEVGGSAVASSCPAYATLRDAQGRPTPQGFSCGHVEQREDDRGRVTVWREHGVYHVAATPNGLGLHRSHATRRLNEARQVLARFWHEMKGGAA